MNEKYKRKLEYEVACYERTLCVAWDDSRSEADVYRALDEAYDRWTNPEEHPELQDLCCEEYMLSELSASGLNFEQIEGMEGRK